MDIFHVLNRGVDKRIIFQDKQDHFRFIRNLYEFNNENRIISGYHYFKKSERTNDIASREIEQKPLVDVLAFCLMPNHYHLLLSPRIEKGIPQFMRKLDIGYAKYFNQKYSRVGALFQGRYKSVPVDSDVHFEHLPFYIHLNPLDLSYPEWRKNEISDPKGPLEFLKSYRWSSHLDYLGIKNFPSVLNISLLTEIFGGSSGYKEQIESYLGDIQINTDITLDN